MMTYQNFVVDNITNLNILQSLARERGQLSAFCINAQRICRRKKFDRFASYVDSFAQKPLVLGVTETWFKRGETGEVV